MALPWSRSSSSSAPSDIALLREMALMPRDLAAVVPEARAGDDVVVLVHGFLASAGRLPPAARAARARDGRAGRDLHATRPASGIRRIARRLRDLVERIPRGTRITIVGHSLGGIVAR